MRFRIQHFRVRIWTRIRIQIQGSVFDNQKLKNFKLKKIVFNQKLQFTYP